MTKKKVHLICDNCDWEWDYRGTKTAYATCPNCRRLVNLQKEAQA